VSEFELFEGELQKYRLRAGDLLVVEGNGSESEVGRCARWSDEIPECVHQNHLIRCRPLEQDVEFYTLIFLNSPVGMSIMKGLAVTTSGLYNLSVGKIKSIEIALPPIAEQRRIVAKVDELMVICDELEQHLTEAKAHQSAFAAAAVHHLEV
jgi:type I restriction enzyme S subunit